MLSWAYVSMQKTVLFTFICMIHLFLVMNEHHMHDLTTSPLSLW